MERKTEGQAAERIDVLAVMDAHAAGIAQAMEGRSARWIKTKEIEAGLAEFREARAAVAELAVAGKRVTDAFRVIGSNRTAGLVPHGLRIEAEQAMLALDAALRPFTGEQA